MEQDRKVLVVVENKTPMTVDGFEGFAVAVPFHMDIGSPYGEMVTFFGSPFGNIIRERESYDDYERKRKRAEE